MTRAAAKRRRRRRQAARRSDRVWLGSDEARFRLAARVALGLGLGLLALAIALSWGHPHGSRALGSSGNLALRVAGIGLVIASTLFGRVGKTR